MYADAGLEEGFVNFFFQGAWKIANMIHEADLDRFLVRPIPAGLQLLTARIDFDGLSKMSIALAVLLLAAARSRIVWTWAEILLCLFFLVQACIIRVCMIWIASCASFWMAGRRNSLNFFVISLGEMAKYPLTIYPALLRGIFGYVIPYAFSAITRWASCLERKEWDSGRRVLPWCARGC